MIAITQFAQQQTVRVRMMDDPMPGWGMGWGMGFGLLWIILLLVIVVLLGVWLVQRANQRDGAAGGSEEAGEKDDPLEIAKRRYAKGEIDQEEFERLKRELE
ncbi:MAG: SHOCT domain-containing protein [Trueperaceae bacterium]|nr:SHOCT domain-containing protein [Trueperaceae bacterium]